MKFSIIERILFLIFFVGSIYLFIRTLLYRYRIVLKGSKKPEINFKRGIKRVLTLVFTQYVLVKQRPLPGIFHAFIFWGFFVFLLSTLDMILSIFGLPSILELKFFSFYRFLLDLFALFVIIGVIGFFVRRFLFKPEGITNPKPSNEVILYGKAKKGPQFESFLILLLIFTLMVTYLFESATGIKIQERVSEGKWFSLIFINFVPESILFWKFNYFLHLVLVFLFLNLIPLSKHFHIINGIINVFLYDLNSYAYIEKIDFEKEDVSFGYLKPEDISFKERFDTFSCIECGRCQDLCPAYASGSSLSPKYLVVNTRELLLEKGEKILKGEDTGIKLKNTVISEEALWACTTCGACMEACPLDIKHIPYILNLRRGEVLTESKFPEELSFFFKNMEQKQNPWGLWSDERIKWMEGLNVPLAREKNNFEYLYFVGCASSFDKRLNNIARSVIKILNHLEVDYAVLGDEEICNGDPARRTGNEYLFQMMVEANIEILKKYNFNKILVHCPHCFNIFKNEYPDFGFKKEVIHISEFLNSFIKKGNLKLKVDKKDYTFHDPCYLGRHNGIFDEPRKIIKTFGRLKELKNSREFSFCCGAGGGRMWMETKKGKKVNQVRMKEIKDFGVKNVLVSCPFCLRMLEDGKKEIDAEEFEIMDITEIIALNLFTK
ncbi:MAG: 4Fe-4S dicluster domain-containing protein [candidate division WOR-3 bacterium]